MSVMSMLVRIRRVSSSMHASMIDTLLFIAVFTKPGCDLDVSPATCCCAGMGCLRQKMSGSEPSIAFLNAGGTIVYRSLQEGETVTVDTNSLLALESGVYLGITPNGRCGTMLCGGESCFSTTVTGPGKVFMQVRTVRCYYYLLFVECRCSSALASPLEHEFLQIPASRATDSCGRKRSRCAEYVTLPTRIMRRRCFLLPRDYNPQHVYT